jgi:hypothetical protein
MTDGARRAVLNVERNEAASRGISSERGNVMAKYSKGDHVSWNSEAGRVSGTIIKVHERDFDYKGHCHRASKDAPQYEIKSDKTDHLAAHKEGVLTKIA